MIILFKLRSELGIKTLRGGPKKQTHLEEDRLVVEIPSLCFLSSLLSLKVPPPPPPPPPFTTLHSTWWSASLNLHPTLPCHVLIPPVRLHPSHILTWKALNLCCCISWPPVKDESNMATLSLLCLSIDLSVSLSVCLKHTHFSPCFFTHLKEEEEKLKYQNWKRSWSLLVVWTTKNSWQNVFATSLGLMKKQRVWKWF